MSLRHSSDESLDTQLARPSVTYCKLGAPESAVQGKTTTPSRRVARNVTARERSHGFRDY